MRQVFGSLPRITSKAMVFAVAVGVSIVCLLPGVSRAQYSITTLGTAVTENFSSAPLTSAGYIAGSNNSFNTNMGNSSIGNNTWVIAQTNAAPAVNNSTFNFKGAENGNISGNGFSVFSTDPTNSGTTNRAFGYLAGGNAQNAAMTAAFTNNSGSAITSLVIGYTGAQWRIGVTRNTQLLVQYSVDGTNFLPAASSVSALIFNAPQISGPNNTAISPSGNNAVLSANVAANVASGSTFYIRWEYLGGQSGSGARQSLSIDDVSVTGNASAYTPKNITWAGPSASNWDTSTTDFTNNSGGAATAFTNTDNVTFGDTGVGAVTIQAPGVQPGSVAVTNSSGTYTFTNASGAIGIAGNTGLTKSNGGTLVLASQNTYSGNTALNGGWVSIANDNALGNGGGIVFNGGTLLTSASITSARGITMTGAGAFDTGGFDSTLSSSFTGTGAFTKAGAGSLTLTGSVPSGNLSISQGALVLAAAGSPTDNLTAASAGGGLVGDLIVRNTPRVNFNSGSFSGGGTIKVENSGTSFTNASGSLGGSIGNAILLNSTASPNTPGAVNITPYAFGTFVTTIGATSGGGEIYNNVISGNSDVNIGNSATGGGAGSVTFAAQNTWTGTTEINVGNGTIILAHADALPDTNVIVGTRSGLAAPFLDLNGNNLHIASLSDGTATTATKLLTVINKGANDATLTIDGSLTPAGGFSGVLSDGGATNKLNVTVNSSNIFKLTNANTYTGTTTVNAGTLITSKNGSLAAGSAVTVNGGYFGGAGTINGSVSVNSGGTLVEGNPSTTTGIGTLTVNNSLTLSTGATFVVKAQNSASPSEGVDADVVTVGGSGSVFTVGGATLQFTPLTSSFATLPQTYRIVDATAGGTSIDFSSPFANLANGTTYNDGSVAYTVSYSSSEIDLTVSAVPEPSSVFMLGLAAAGALARCRRRPAAR